VPRAGAEALATPVSGSESGYTIVFLPTAVDIGTHDLEVKVDVKVKGTRSLEMKKVG
jgi:acyl-CoA hydrolase